MSIRHIVLFRLNAGVLPGDPRVREAIAASSALSNSVAGGQDWHIGPDLSGRDVAVDFAGVGDFASRDALAQFLADPQHRAAAWQWAQVGTITIADIDWPDD